MNLCFAFNYFQKLEEKFNEKEAQKVQLQTSLKVIIIFLISQISIYFLLFFLYLNDLKIQEKAETEFRRLRQTFCFKARPLPSFYNNERETPKSMIKRVCIKYILRLEFEKIYIFFKNENIFWGIKCVFVFVDSTSTREFEFEVSKCNAYKKTSDNNNGIITTVFHQEIF